MHYLEYYNLLALIQQVYILQHILTYIFQNTEIYNYAIQLQYLRNFRILSLYKKYKIASLKYGIKCISLFFKKDFTISIYHLIFRWIKC